VTEPRIITVTVNPTVDIACAADAVYPLHKVRTAAEMQDPGGGGVNVARVVHELGGDVLAVLLAGGFPGQFLLELLAEEKVPCRALRIDGRTRISYTVHDRKSQQEYRFVAQGPQVSAAEWQAVLTAVAEEPGEWIVASGSLAPGMPEDFYAQLARLVVAQGRHFALDTSGGPLKMALRQGLALIKPSQGEFEALVGHKMRRDAELEHAALELVRGGAAERVVVTRGHLSAVLATRAGVQHLSPVGVDAHSAVGAGDSFAGAMVLALARGASDEEAFAWGMAGGGAAVMHPGTAHPKRCDVEQLYRRMRVHQADEAAAGFALP
jgi:6-phosphofructokinase 2